MKHTVYLFFKRLFDIFFGLIGTFLLIPITIIIKIAYLLSGDTHPIFFTQKRIGKHGKVFKIYKFRSMVHNADEVLKELLKDPKYKEEWRKNQKFNHDPRITKVGKIIRKTSIDECPQFLNLLTGSISLIGPRPLIPGELTTHKGRPEIYQSVKPGITGYWAVSGRSNTSYPKRLKLEYYYIDHQSFSLDWEIFWKTFAVALKKEGAK